LPGQRGRELEIADLLAFIRREGIRNIVWLTADVHYCAAHHYSPERAAFKEFDPFWEFVAGPLHAGAFGPGKTDARSVSTSCSRRRRMRRTSRQPIRTSSSDKSTSTVRVGR
jgi:phosphodiesterase/alkaline phosphatase D-like protein